MIEDKENIDSNFRNTDGTLNRKSFEKFRFQNTQKSFEENFQNNEKFYEIQGFGIYK